MPKTYQFQPFLVPEPHVTPAVCVNIHGSPFSSPSYQNGNGLFWVTIDRKEKPG